MSRVLINLPVLMAKRRLTRKRLAEMSGISAHTIGKWYAGKVNYPPLKQVGL